MPGYFGNYFGGGVYGNVYGGGTPAPTSGQATANFSAGTSKAGLTDLSVQPYAGVTPTGPAIANVDGEPPVIVEVGGGMYDFAGSVPDNATGGRLISVSQGTLDSQPFARSSTGNSYTFDGSETTLG